MEKWKAKEKSIEETNDLPIFISSPLLLRPLRPMIYVGIKSYWKNCWQKKYKYLRKILFESQEADTQDRRIENRFRCWIRRGLCLGLPLLESGFQALWRAVGWQMQMIRPFDVLPTTNFSHKKKAQTLKLGLEIFSVFKELGGAVFVASFNYNESAA